jgi:transcriptional antiterminator NusG
VDEKRGKTSTAAPFRVGDPIKVIDGPFNDFSGFVQEINQEKQKVKVMVSIFGRATPVELDFLQVELEK